MSLRGEYHDRPVRPYVVTGGRVRPSRVAIRPEMLLIATDAGKPLPVSASSEERALLAMCRRLLSLVEAAVHLQLPVSVVSVVAGDLIDEGFLAMRASSDELMPGGAARSGGAAQPGGAGRPGGAARPGGTGQSGGAGSARPDLALLQDVLNGLRKLREPAAGDAG